MGIDDAAVLLEKCNVPLNFISEKLALTYGAYGRS